MNKTIPLMAMTRSPVVSLLRSMDFLRTTPVRGAVRAPREAAHHGSGAVASIPKMAQPHRSWPDRALGSSREAARSACIGERDDPRRPSSTRASPSTSWSSTASAAPSAGPRLPACPSRSSSARRSVPTSTVRRYTHRVVDVLKRHEIDLVAMAGFGTILSEEVHEAFPGRVVNTHPALLPAFKGWHAVRDSLAAGREGDRAAPCTSRRSRSTTGRSSPRKPFPCCRPTPRSRLHERIKEVERRIYPQVLREILDAPRTTAMTAERRALLSVYDKTGLVDFAAGSTSWGSSSCRRGGTAAGDRRRRRAGDAAVRHDRSAGDARAPGRDAAPEGARRDPRRPRQGSRTAPTSRRTASSRSISSCRTSTRSTSKPDIETDRHRWARDDPRRGEEPRVGRRRDGARPVRARCSTSCAPTAGAHRRDASTRWRVEAFARTAAYDAAIVRWLDGDELLPRRTSCSPLERTVRGAPLRREPAPARRALPDRGHHELVGRRRAAQRPRPVVPQPLRRRRGVAAGARPRIDGVDAPTCAIIKHANPCGVADRRRPCRPPTNARYECDERSAFGGIVAFNRPVDTATAERMIAGRRPMS